MFSIIVPIYNEEENINELVSEIYTSLWEYNDFELLIVNDCSNDNTVEVTHDHDAVVSVCGEYYKNKYTGEWLSELEAEQAMIDKYEEDESNKYY